MKLRAKQTAEGIDSWILYNLGTKRWLAILKALKRRVWIKRKDGAAPFTREALEKLYPKPKHTIEWWPYGH